MYNAPGTTQKLPGPSLRLSLILTILGAAIAVPTFIVGLLPILDALDQREFSVPGTITEHLEKGTWVVYEHSGSNSLGSTFDDPVITIQPNDVTVTGPDGPVRTYRPEFYNDVLTQTDSNRRFTGAVRFQAPTEGEYTIRVDGVRPTTVIIASPFIDTLADSIVWFVFAGVGGVVFVVGLVLLIVGSVRRSRYRSAMTFAIPQYGASPYAANQSPPGWHPDPGGSGRLRYWDGTRWTDHLH